MRPPGTRPRLPSGPQPVDALITGANAQHAVTSSPAALERWRRDTPGCRDRIHLNNAGAAFMPRSVVDTLTRHLAREPAVAGSQAADETAPRTARAYDLVPPPLRTAPPH